MSKYTFSVLVSDSAVDFFLLLHSTLKSAPISSNYSPNFVITIAAVIVEHRNNELLALLK